MSLTLNKDKAKALAIEYCGNGFCKAAALRAVGYPDAQAAKSRTAKLFDSPAVRKEIDEIMDRNAAVCDVKISEIVQGLRSIAFPAEDKKVKDSDRNTALAHLAKYKNMFIDRIVLDQQSEQDQKIDENKRIACQVMAELYFRYGAEIKAEIKRREAAAGSASFSDRDILSGEGDKNAAT